DVGTQGKADDVQASCHRVVGRAGDVARGTVTAPYLGVATRQVEFGHLGRTRERVAAERGALPEMQLELTPIEGEGRRLIPARTLAQAGHGGVGRTDPDAGVVVTVAPGHPAEALRVGRQPVGRALRRAGRAGRGILSRVPTVEIVGR